jgi:hypothetical protein
LLEYDNNKGFRCQKCQEWTLGGNLYSSQKGLRVCFLCHLDEVSREMAKRFSEIEHLESSPSLTDLEPILNTDIEGMVSNLDMPGLGGSPERIEKSLRDI